jgi:hypothetical protein
MSETLFRFLVSELTAARLVCGKCGVVTEAPLGTLAEEREVGQGCSHCNTPFIEAGLPPPVLQLAQAIQHLKSLEKQVKVEFTLPHK